MFLYAFLSLCHRSTIINCIALDTITAFIHFYHNFAAERIHPNARQHRTRRPHYSKTACRRCGMLYLRSFPFRCNPDMRFAASYIFIFFTGIVTNDLPPTKNVDHHLAVVTGLIKADRIPFVKDRRVASIRAAAYRTYNTIPAESPATHHIHSTSCFRCEILWQLIHIVRRIV